MSGKKMFPPKIPAKALAKLRTEFDTIDIKPDVRILDDGVLLCFDSATQFVLMRSTGAQQLAALLIAKAEQLERLSRGR